MGKAGEQWIAGWHKDICKKIIEKNLRNSVFADITASEEVADVYKGLLEKSISVVACNKIACSSAYSVYQKLKQTAREYNTNFYLKQMWAQASL